MKKQDAFNKIFEHAALPLGTVTGMVVGVAISKTLDKMLASDTVSGLVGAELSGMGRKYLKPIIVSGAGLLGYGYAVQQKWKPFAQYVCVGVAAYGMYDGAKALLNKDILVGTEEAIDGILGNPDTKTEYKPISLPYIKGFDEDAEKNVLPAYIKGAEDEYMGAEEVAEAAYIR